MNVKAFDLWTIVHLGAGLLLAFLRVPRPIAYGLIILVELVEFMLRGMSNFFRESRANILADLAIGIGAYEIGRALR